jgi:hypothetical protein
MREFTLGRCPVSASSVEKPLSRSHTSAIIRSLTREEPLKVEKLSQKSDLRKHQRILTVGQS